MGKGGKRARARNAQIPVYSGPLGRWGAFLAHRGQVIAKLEPAGPTVTASSPEVLRARTEEAMAPLDPLADKPEA